MATFPLRLPGWEEQSIIGFDEQLRWWFAQLWPNGSTSDPPAASVSAPSPAGLAGPIGAATSVATGDVEAAVREAWEVSRQTEGWQQR